MICKKDLSSDDLDTLRRSRNSAVLLAANGEVQTNEEAQENVHNLNLFVTVQFLEETTAVLSLGKLCEGHGYSHEWVSGQKPRLTKEEKTIVCKTDNFVPLVVLGLSISSGSNSSSTSALEDLSSTSPAQERSDRLAPWRIGSRKLVRITSQNPNKNKKGDGSRDADDLLRDLPEWLEEFTDHLEDTPALAHISQESDSERPSKVVSKQGSIVLKLTSQKTEIAKSACEPKWQGLLAEDALAQYLEQKSLMTW